MRYKIEINREGCIACGLCYASDPAHFTRGEDGRSRVVGGTGEETSVGIFVDESIEAARNAADGCPVSVITVTET